MSEQTENADGAPPRAGWRGRRVESFRFHLARGDALAALCLLGALAGIATGLVIVAFRLLSEGAMVWAGLMRDAESFELLDWHWRLVLPVAGGVVLGLLFQAVPPPTRQVGPVHVMARLATNGGRLPLINAVMQFVGGAISIACGHSVGREGPVIHVGAASASLVGQWMGLPNNSIRVLVACGVAGAIAASFNTPIAGVVFAMEVVMLEYTMIGFAPVLLAAFSAAWVSRLAFGAAPAFAVPQFQLLSMMELPWVGALGLAIGVLAAAYVAGVRWLDTRSRSLPVWARMTLAGFIVAACGLVAPEVMGLGYDTVELCLVGALGVASLLRIVLFKLLATIACGGLALPGGVIGPMLVMGATMGGALGALGAMLSGQPTSEAGFYAALGMVAMMGASLQAPLAALMAILELTGNPNTLMPGMVAVVSSLLVARTMLRQEPLFVSILRARDIPFRFDPIGQAMDRIGVGAVMSRRFVVLPVTSDVEAAEHAASSEVDWVVVVQDQQVVALLPPARLKTTLEHAAAHGASEGETPPHAPLAEVIVDGQSRGFVTVSPHATLREALHAMQQGGCRVALVASGSAPTRGNLYGIVDRARIDDGTFYRF